MTLLRHLALVAVAMVAGVCAMSAQTPEQWRDSLSAINRQIAGSAFSADLHLRKAAVNIQLMQWDYAIEEYNFVLEREPRNLAALYYRAFAHANLRHYDNAQADYESVLKLAPNNRHAMLGLVYVLSCKGKNSNALDYSNRLVELFPDSSIVYAVRAGVEKDMKAYDMALGDWTEAIRLSPANIDYQVSKVDILILMGRKKQAKNELDAIVRRGTPRGALREMYDRLK